MAIDVRIPTILRTYTAGEKAVEGTGYTLTELFADLDTKYPGLRDRLIKDGALHRFINIYINDEDVRFLGSLDATLSDGDSVTILPAVAGGAPAAGSAQCGAGMVHGGAGTVHGGAGQFQGEAGQFHGVTGSARSEAGPIRRS